MRVCVRRNEFVHYPYYIAAKGDNQVISDDGTKAVFNTPEVLASYGLVNDLFRKGYSAAGPFDVDPFLGGVVASTLEGAWNLNTIKTSAPEDFEFIMGPLPKPDDATHEGNPAFLRAQPELDARARKARRGSAGGSIAPPGSS